jgi:hypothetical protein
MTMRLDHVGVLVADLDAEASGSFIVQLTEAQR